MGPKADAESVQIRGQQIRVIRVNGKATFAEEWRKWLMTMARYPVGIQVWRTERDMPYIILSSREKDSYRLREAVQDTLTLLQAFHPQELDTSDAARLWKDILGQKVKYVKENGAFVEQNSQKYTAFVTVNRWGDVTDGNLITELLSLGEHIKISHHINVLPSVKANALFGDMFCAIKTALPLLLP